MSAITDFYRGEKNAHGKTLVEILSYSDKDLEEDHTYIQWLFPLPEPSRAVPDSPVATPDDLETLATDPVLHDRVFMAAERMARFFRNTTAWMQPYNHNHLRITRIIRCLALTDHKEIAHAWRIYFTDRAHLYRIPVRTVRFWQEATEKHPAFLDVNINRAG